MTKSKQGSGKRQLQERNFEVVVNHTSRLIVLHTSPLTFLPCYSSIWSQTKWVFKSTDINVQCLISVMPSPRCRICMALPVIQSRSPEHTYCSTVQLCLLQSSLPLLDHSCMLCSMPCLLPCLAAVAAAAPPAGCCTSVNCPGRFCGLRLVASATKAGVLHVRLASERSQPSFATITAKTVRVCTLLAGWPVAEAQLRSLCCIADVAGLLHVC